MDSIGKTQPADGPTRIATSEHPIEPRAHGAGGWAKRASRKPSAARSWTHAWDASRPRVLSLAFSCLLYVAFAALVYAAHGPEPALTMDHLAYMQMADEVRASHPDGGYWRSFDTRRSYAVLMAYATDWTGSHIESLKLLLAGMTVAYLLAFQVLAVSLTESFLIGTIGSLLSAFMVSFGASFWGVSDFSASLNRTLVVPFLVLVLWLFFRARGSGWRYAAYPVLVSLSLLHLGSYHLLLALFAYEALEFVFVRRARIDRRVWQCAVGVLAAFSLNQLIETSGLGTSGFVVSTLQRSLGPLLAWWSVPDAPALLPVPLARLPVEAAWALEQYAFPWRNLPPPLTTIANIALSYGVILLLSVGAAVVVRRREGWSETDRTMLVFAGAVLAAAYGLQTGVLLARVFYPVYPINFEEVRALRFLLIPSLYFMMRLAAALVRSPSSGVRQWALAASLGAAFVLQPIVVVRAAPAPWREELLARLIDAGVLRAGDTPRLQYARQYLSLPEEGPRLFYGTRGVLDWLDRNARAGDAVLTDRNELILSGLPLVGAFQPVMQHPVTHPARQRWKLGIDEVHAALESRDIARVCDVARRWEATIAVVPWQVADAAYRDEHFSVVRCD